MRRRAKGKLPRLKQDVERLASEIVRKRDKVCQAKGADGRGCWGYLQASHIYPKGAYPHMKFDIENMIGLCTHHHINWWHKNPIEAGKWVKEYLSGDILERLRLTSQVMIQWRIKELEELRGELEEKLKYYEEEM